MSRLGSKEVRDETISSILADVGKAQMHFEDFLDVTAALSDEVLNAFIDIVREVKRGGEAYHVDPVGGHANEDSQDRDARRTIPVEKSGGGW